MRGATGYIGNDLTLLAVSIHAPRAGRDECPAYKFPVEEFQSTRPVRGATLIVYGERLAALVSIHAPRAGRDDVLGVFHPA